MRINNLYALIIKINIKNVFFNLKFIIMKTKKTMLVLAGIATGLMMTLSTALPFKTVADNPPMKKFHADTIYNVSSTITQRDLYTYDCELLMSQLNQRLTLGVWTNYQLTDYTYDVNGLLQTKFITPFGTREQLYTYTYDAEGNMLTELLQRRNLGTTIWEDYEIRYFTYDGNALLIQDLKLRVVSGSWINNMLTTYTYDQNGNRLTKLIQSWNNTSMTWTNSELATMTYDSCNNQISSMSQLYFSGTWNNQTINIKTYDENGNLITQLVQSWMGGQWNNALFINFTRGLDGNLLLYTMDRWVSGKWENYLKTIYNYQPGFISGQSYSWDVVLEEWLIGGNSLIQLALFIDGNETLFGTASGYAYVYYSQDIYAETSPYQTVYPGYPPMECVEVSAVASGGTPPYSYEWSNGVTTESFMACPQQSTAYTVTVTDANSCTFVSETRVCALNVLCGKNLNKIALCHCPPGNPNNCKTLCVGINDVPNHLAHGDVLGYCGFECTDDKSSHIFEYSFIIEEEFSLDIYPNPSTGSSTVLFMLPQSGYAAIIMSNVLGQKVKTIFEGNVEGNVINIKDINMHHLPTGMYYMVLRNSEGESLSRRIVLQ
jgi:hypothetical protein